jgi:uncharacterized repeat protein (TIGR01451 family)
MASAKLESKVSARRIDRRAREDGSVQMKATFAGGSSRVRWFCWLARGSALAVAAAALIGLPSVASAATTPVPLGTAANFAVLAGSAITNTGATVINGNLGMSPGTSVTGFPPGTVTGTEDVANPVAVQAKDDLTTAYNDAAAESVDATIPTELGGTIEAPGVYNSAAGTFSITTGTLTLDAEGDPNAIFIFQAASTLDTAAASNVSLIDGAQASNVFWVVGTAVTIGANSSFQGNILAHTSITVQTGATIFGRALAIGTTVTLDTDTITTPIPGLTISITASADSAAPGDTVHYTLTIADTGNSAYAGAAVTDSLADVLDDATYRGDPVATSGAVSFASPDLTWTGDLSPGDTVTVTYSVSVNDPETGNLTLGNTVSSADPGINCPSGSSDPECSSSIPVVLGVLSITAPASASLGSAAPGGGADASLGTVQVTDGRAGVTGWTATASATDFTTGVGDPAETIPVDDVRYLVSGFTSTTGSATFTPTPLTDLSGAAQTVVTATNVDGDNSAAWNPTIQVLVPPAAVGGLYSGTITHSVS